MFIGYNDHEVCATPLGGSINHWICGDRYVLGPVSRKMVEAPTPSGSTFKRRGLSHWCFPNFGSAPNKAGLLGLPKHGVLRDTLLLPSRVQEQQMEFWNHIELGGVPDVGVGVSMKIGHHLPNNGSARLNLTLMAHVQQDDGEPIRVPILPAWHPYFAGPATVTIGGREIEVGPDPAIIERADTITIVLKDRGIVTIIPSFSCHWLVVWSDDPAKYVCVEPVFGGRPGTFGTDEQETFLEPDKPFTCFVNTIFTPF
ncbi:MAG: hypothetical protein PHH01_02270 [Patescibacteria group bacterium]|nr:hypothetical protein [Patescibacteria group bacterium]